VGQNFRVWQHPEQGATQPVGEVWQRIDQVLLSLVKFACGWPLEAWISSLTAFGRNLSLYCSSYCIGGQPILLLLGISSKSADLLNTGSPYNLNKGQI
jgi:hypothetical protein